MLIFEDVAAYCAGNVPVILCSHHDGLSAELLNGRPLLMLRGRHNDGGTRDLTLRIANIMRNSGKKPHLAIFNIDIRRSTDEMFDLYLQKVFSAVRDCLIRFGKCAIIDIHRFYKHPDLTSDIRSQYDIWFGTDHRRSVRDDFDKKLAAAIIGAYKRLCGQEISVYVPEEMEKIGERFGATGKTPGKTILTKKVGDAFLGQRVSAVQVEFYIDHLRKGEPIAMLAAAFAGALAQSI